MTERMPGNETARLLVIEDEPGQRSGLVRRLEAEGYEVHVSKNGREGLETIRTVAPELVLCDGAVSDLDGPEFCRTVKADPELPASWLNLDQTRFLVTRDAVDMNRL